MYVQRCNVFFPATIKMTSCSHTLRIFPPCHWSNTLRAIWENYISRVKPASFCSFHRNVQPPANEDPSLQRLFWKRTPGPKCPCESFHTSRSKQATVARETPHVWRQKQQLLRVCVCVFEGEGVITLHAGEKKKRKRRLNQMGIKTCVCLFHTPAVGPC